MSHRTAVALMVLCTLLWSMAGIVTRLLDSARSFEITFWRSFFNAITLIILLSIIRGPALWKSIRTGGWPLWFSGLCWSIMYTAYMVAMTKTTVANVLLTLAIGPLLTALFTSVFLRYKLPLRTWIAIVIAGIGIAWMFWERAVAGVSLVGTIIALAVPIANSCNLTLMQYLSVRNKTENKPVDLLPAVLIGASLSALATLPLAWPFEASLHDISLLGMLGAIQLAVPCLLLVRLTRELPAAELSLLNLLEVIFGITWVWIFVNEAPATATLTGGALVIGALIGNSLAKLRNPDS